MKLIRFLVIPAVIVATLLTGVPALAADGSTPAPAGYADRILVQFKDGTDVNTMLALGQQHGDAITQDLSQIGTLVVAIPAGKMDENLAALRASPDVVFAEPDYTARTMEVPSDPYYTNEWGLATVQASQAWDVTHSAPDISIAILDTGIDQDNPDLAAKVVANQNFTDSATADDLFGHGTHAAGIAAAITNNGTGVAGLGWSASLMNVKVLGDDGSGTNSWIANGIIWAADNGARVISMSLGSTQPSSTLQNAVDYAWSKGVVVVAAAGNDGTNEPNYPAYYQNAIAVAATNSSDQRASFSNYGSWVDVAAPGQNIYSTLPNHAHNREIQGSNYGNLSGTSMATPFVAGEAALIWATSYGTSNASVRNRIEGTADQIAGTGTYWTYGRIDAARAVAGNTGAPAPAPTPAPAPAPAPAPNPAGGRYEYYAGYSNYSALAGAAQRGQTFTAQTDHAMTKIRLPLFRTAYASGSITVSIRATDENGLPTGPDLASGTIAVSSVTGARSPVWYDVDLGAGTTLQAGATYAIVLAAPDASSSAPVYFWVSTAGSYTGGTVVYSTNGAPWNNASTRNWDMPFEVWG